MCVLRGTFTEISLLADPRPMLIQKSVEFTFVNQLLVHLSDKYANVPDSLSETDKHV